MLRWYAARTRALAEYGARAHLESEGIETFLPCVNTPTPRRGHDDGPLFPGYLFVRCDLEEQGSQWLRGTATLVGLVRFDGVPAALPDEVITELTERVEAIDQSGGHWRRFREGEVVTVNSGSIHQLGQVVAGTKSPEGRVRLLLEFMGRHVYAEVPWKHLGLAASAGNEVGEHRTPRRTRGKGRWIGGFGPRGLASA